MVSMWVTQVSNCSRSHQQCSHGALNNICCGLLEAYAARARASRSTILGRMNSAQVTIFHLSFRPTHQESVDFLSQPIRQTGAVISFRHLLLQERDMANQLWVGVATDTTSVFCLAPPPDASGGGSVWGSNIRGGDPVLGWARGAWGREQLALYGKKIDRLLGGG